MTASALQATWQFRLPELNWSRISAWSGSFSFHLALALALLVPPVAMELRRAADPDPIFARLPVAEPEAMKEPDLPTPPKFKRKLVAAPPVPNITITKPEFVAATPTNTIAPLDSTPAALSDAASDVAGAADTPPSALAYRNRTAIPYPHDALMRHEQGKVILRVFVGADGAPQQIEIERSSGSPSLDRAARDAVRHWSFQPGRRGGVAYAAWALVPISFSLP